MENINAELEEKVIKRTEQLKKSNEELEAFSIILYRMTLGRLYGPLLAFRQF